MEEVPYEIEALEGENACDPGCMNDSICQNEICFCASPYAGTTCEEELEVVTRVGYFTLVLVIILALILGFLTAFLLKFLYDSIFLKEVEEPEEAADEWNN